MYQRNYLNINPENYLIFFEKDQIFIPETNSSLNSLYIWENEWIYIKLWISNENYKKNKNEDTPLNIFNITTTAIRNSFRYISPIFRYLLFPVSLKQHYKNTGYDLNTNEVAHILSEKSVIWYPMHYTYIQGKIVLKNMNIQINKITKYIIKSFN